MEKCTTGCRFRVSESLQEANKETRLNDRENRTSVEGGGGKNDICFEQVSKSPFGNRAVVMAAFSDGPAQQ